MVDRLPIESVIEKIKDGLTEGRVVLLQAPPGSGKTTQVPLALLNNPPFRSQKILLLEPRRIAARAAARWMSHLLGEKVGGKVGFRTRLESCVSKDTRIEVVTEGVLTRMLQDDPSLPGIGCVIFDEFHERSIHADLGLALCLDTRNSLRPDLAVIVMSATLNSEPLQRIVPTSLLVTCSSQTFPVKTIYASASLGNSSDIAPSVARVTIKCLTEHAGSVLVFLPGVAEIHRTARYLEERIADPGIFIRPLHGGLSASDQDNAILPPVEGTRKVVLATSIAETSLTIAGVSVVVDSGLMRVPRFDPRTGLTRLHTVRVTRSAAEQRAGRAGRLGPGTCFRLWTEREHAGLVETSPAEITHADLLPLALELAAWGIRELHELRWVDSPAPAAFAQAQQFLKKLGAIDGAAVITRYGRAMSQLPLHPRLSYMVVRANEAGWGALACNIAALLSEQDGRSSITNKVEFSLTLEALCNASPRTETRVKQFASSLRRRLGLSPDDPINCEYAGIVLAWAYPDRIARQRGADIRRYVLSNGRGARLPQRSDLLGAPFLVVAEVGGFAGDDDTIFSALPLAANAFENALCDLVKEEVIVAWDAELAGVVSVRRLSCGAIVLQEVNLASPDPARAYRELVAAIVRGGLELLPWNEEAKHLRDRMRFIAKHVVGQKKCDWPEINDAWLVDQLEHWLGPFLHAKSRLREISAHDLVSALNGLLTPQQRLLLNEWAPEALTVASGSQIAVDYSEEPPVLSVRLQEVFGWKDTPRLAGGQVPIKLVLLSPARRPVQVTQDLANFWRHGYIAVRKELKGRYPKHFWPEDPLMASATRGPKPR